MILPSPKKISEIPKELKNATTDDIVKAHQKILEDYLKKNNTKYKIYNVKGEPLPDDMKNEVMKQKIIVYELPAQVIHLPDGRTIKIKKTTAKEHFFELPEK